MKKYSTKIIPDGNPEITTNAKGTNINIKGAAFIKLTPEETGKGLKMFYNKHYNPPKTRYESLNRIDEYLEFTKDVCNKCKFIRFNPNNGKYFCFNTACWNYSELEYMSEDELLEFYRYILLEGKNNG